MKKLFTALLNLILTVYRYGFFIIYHAVSIPFGLLMLIFRTMRLLRLITSLWCKSLFLFGFQPLHIKGTENLTAKGKYLFVMNHSSFFDIHAVLAIRPGITWLSKKEVLKLPLIGIGLTMSGGIPIDRQNFNESMEKAYETVRQAGPGFTLGIFPEGTRTRDGNIQKFKRGFVRILRNSDLQLVPITLNGFFEFKPKRRWTFHQVKRLEAIIHNPIPQETLRNMTDQEIIDIVHDTIQSGYRI